VNAAVSALGYEAVTHTVCNVSGNGVAVYGEIPQAVGEHVEVMVDYVGGGTARVVRKGDNETAFEFIDANTDLQDRRIRWHASAASDHRRHQRVRPRPKGDRTIVAPVVLPDGTQHEADVHDVSAGGVKVAALNVQPGDRLRVADQPAKVVRVEQHAVAVAFDTEANLRKLRVYPKAMS
jgi:hypothetical protein